MARHAPVPRRRQHCLHIRRVSWKAPPYLERHRYLAQGRRLLAFSRQTALRGGVRHIDQPLARILRGIERNGTLLKVRVGHAPNFDPVAEFPSKSRQICHLHPTRTDVRCTKPRYQTLSLRRPRIRERRRAFESHTVTQRHGARPLCRPTLG